MKSILKKSAPRVVAGLLTLNIALASSALAMGKALPTESGNSCLDEGKEFLERRFGKEVKVRKTFSINPDRNSGVWLIYFYTDLCDGAFAMNFRGDNQACTAPNYLTRTRLLDRVYATEACRDLMPGDEYPAL